MTGETGTGARTRVSGTSSAREWTVTEVGGAAAIPPAEWGPLVRRGFHLRDWFAAAEGDPALRPRHLSVRRGGVLRCLAPVYVESSRLHGDLHGRWFGALARPLAALGLRLRPTLVVCGPFATSSDVLGGLEGLPAAVFAELLARLEELAERERVRAVVWPFVGADHPRLLQACAEAGYVAAFAGSTAVLNREGASFEEYVRTRGKGVRRTIAADLAALREADVNTDHETPLAELAPEHGALYAASYRRRNRRAPVLDPAFFERLAGRDPRDVWAQATRRRGRLVALSLNLAGGDTLDGGFAAYAEAELGGPTYVNDAFYEPFRAACRRGVDRLDLGPGALYPKVLRGARLQARFGLVRGCGAVAHEAVRRLAPLVAARNRAKEAAALGPLARRFASSAPLPAA